MPYLASNIKLLRRARELSQQALASALDMKRSTLSSYENGFSEPNMEVLERMASFFGTSLDQLVSLDLSLIDTDELLRQKNETAADISGDTLRVLATTVSPDNEENVEVVPASARAGYAAGYDDPEFVASLPHMSLPFLSPQKKYRAFPVTGDSMPPVAQGSYVVGQYLVDWRDLREGQYAVVVTREDGIVFKKTYPDFNNGKLRLVSTNPDYNPYDIDLSQVLEIWVFAGYVSQTIMEITSPADQMQRLLAELKNDVYELKNKVGM